MSSLRGIVFFLLLIVSLARGLSILLIFERIRIFLFYWFFYFFFGWDQTILLRGFGGRSKSWEDNDIRRPSRAICKNKSCGWGVRCARKPVYSQPPRQPDSDSSSHHPRQQSNTCFIWDVITAGRPPSARLPGPRHKTNTTSPTQLWFSSYIWDYSLGKFLVIYNHSWKSRASLGSQW